VADWVAYNPLSEQSGQPGHVYLQADPGVGRIPTDVAAVGYRLPSGKGTLGLNGHVEVLGTEQRGADSISNGGNIIVVHPTRISQ